MSSGWSHLQVAELLYTGPHQGKEQGEDRQFKWSQLGRADEKGEVQAAVAGFMCPRAP